MLCRHLHRSINGGTGHRQPASRGGTAIAQEYHTRWYILCPARRLNLFTICCDFISNEAMPR
jgi:hypothetical protein